MMKNRFMEYGLDLQYEFKTYKHVGKDYGNRKIANKGWIKNFRRFWRKSIVNKKEQKYKFCNTYSEWRDHVKGLIPKKSEYYDNFLHFLILEKKDAETFLETIKVILIPIYIAMCGMTSVFPLNDTFSVIAIMLIIVGFSTGFIYYAKKNVEFYEDFIEIVKEENFEENEK